MSGETSGNLQNNVPGNGSLEVLTGSLPIQVSIDGYNRGMAPLNIRNLSSGFHSVRLAGEGFDQNLGAVIKPHEGTVISIDPTNRQFCLSSITKGDYVDENSVSPLGLTDYGIIIAAFLGITLAGAYATRHVAWKIKNSDKTSSTDLPYISSNDDPGTDALEIVRRRGLGKTDLVLDPLMMICNEGESGDVVVRTINCSSRPIQIEGQAIPHGEMRNILIRVPTGVPGDQFFIRTVPFIDEAGREFIRDVLLRYRVCPVNPALDWSYVEVRSENDSTTAIVRMKNSSSHPVTAGNLEILPDSEGELEFTLGDPDDDHPEISRMVPVKPGKEAEPDVILNIVIPYNRGVMLQSQNKLDEALSYYNSLFTRDAGSADLWIQKGLVLEKLGKPEEAGVAYRQALDIDPLNVNAQKAMQKTEKRGIIQLNPKKSDYHSFPVDLMEQYSPVTLINSYQNGELFIVKRAVDASIQMIKVIDPDIVEIPSYHQILQVWRSLDHPHIVRLITYEGKPVPHLVAVPPEGVVQKGRRRYTVADLSLPIPKRAVVKIGLGICQGLLYLHNQGVSHNLLDPSEVFIDRNLHIRIGGFDGAAVLSEKGCESVCWLLAPEQMDPKRHWGPGKKTDLFQTGTILYLLLTGSRPYGLSEGIILAADFWNIHSLHLVLPSQVRSDLGLFDTLISRALSIDSQNRYDSVDEMLIELESIQSILDNLNRQ
ncbi:MAG TPA: tetratricopeptide repeat protein [Methanospirillum sp.]|uniref:protein kinase domain-containing protein n=1 Tax=Methanospirillum sp. TaxID=45200 RepID=UPI002C4EF460|nr:tetratricopeptide repeat protein [Methanospirillum sp.]HWQ64358.1 tetratricopeptide repeat protein [Methanospirillum sp.]